MTTTETRATPSDWTQRLYEVSDVDEQASLLGTLDQRYEQLSGGAYSGALLEIGCDGIDIFRERIGQSVEQQGVGRSGHWTFAAAVSLSAPSYWDGEIIATDALICFEPGQEFELRTPKYAECVGFSVDIDRLHEHLDTWHPERLRRTLSGRSIVTRNRTFIDPAREALLEMIDTALRSPTVFSHASARKMMANTILNRLAAAIDAESSPPSAATTTTTAAASASLIRQSQVARAAREYIYLNAAEPFSVADMCRAVGVSRRTLQYAFESVFGMNPLGYIRAVRLNAVRRELKRPTSTTSVQDCAAHWGFWHLPRFARAYYDMFGELPSTTLRAARTRFGAS